MAAVANGEVKAGKAVLQLTSEAGGGALDLRIVLGRDDHRDLRCLLPAWTRQRARRKRAQRPLGKGQHAGAPLARLRRAGCRVQDQHPGAALQVCPQLRAPGEDVATVGHLTAENRSDECTGNLLALPLRRARALQLQGEQGGHHAGDCRLRWLGRPIAQLADGAVGDPQLDPSNRLAPGEQLALLVGRGAGNRQNGAGAVDQSDAGVQDPCRGPGDGRQAGAGFDRIGERVEHPWIPFVCRLFLPL